MKNIKINLEVKKKLEYFKVDNGFKSLDKALNFILKDAERYTHQEHTDDRTININLSEEVLDLMNECKLCPSESHSDTIERLLREHDDIK